MFHLRYGCSSCYPQGICFTENLTLVHDMMFKICIYKLGLSYTKMLYIIASVFMLVFVLIIMTGSQVCNGE